jgi:hypothetical protein
MGKWLFSRPFLKKVGLTDDQIRRNMVYNSIQHLPSGLAHIFHYGTVSSVISKGKKSYLEVKCKSRNDAKFRIFALLVCNYQLSEKKTL